MRIVLTGAGSGGHFYPNIAVAQAVYELVNERTLVEPELHYIAPTPYDERRLFDLGITFHRCPAGKMRHYLSFQNVIDVFKTAGGIFSAIGTLYRLYPDVVFSKGGFASFPVVIAARILRIPVVIHESDTVPGRANRWISGYARYIAVAWDETVDHFDRAVRDKIAAVGNPVQRELFHPVTRDARSHFELEEGTPTVLVLGGSQGAQRINNTVLETLPELLGDHQIIHQVGPGKQQDVDESVAIILEGNEALAHRYHPIEHLNLLDMRRAAGVADLVISRAGSGAIFEIAAWQLPSILIPLGADVSHDQRSNAYAYARTGAASVMEQDNLTPHLLAAEIQRVLRDRDMYATMQQAAAAFARPDAARHVADALLRIALRHERQEQ